MTGDNFNVITPDDKKHVAYGLCVLGIAATGATFGSLAGGQTVLGFVGGGAMGLLMCKTVEEPLKRALFSQARLSEQQLRGLLLGIRRQSPTVTKSEALNLIASARIEASRNPARYRC